MHGDFRRKLPLADELAAFEIGDHEVLRFEHSFVHASRSGKDAVFVEADGDVALAGYDKAAVVHPLPRGTNFAAVLFFTFLVGGPERVVSHGVHAFLARKFSPGLCSAPSKVNSGPLNGRNPEAHCITLGVDSAQL